MQTDVDRGARRRAGHSRRLRPDHRTTCSYNVGVITGLALNIMFDESPRQRVVQYLTIDEYGMMNHRNSENVSWILKHKVSDKSAANLVSDGEFTALVDR